MAWTSISGSISAESTSNHLSLVHTLSGTNLGVGEVGIFAIAQDNPGATDTFTTSGAANPAVTTVTDSAGNVWHCAGEQQLGGLAGFGVVCSVWWSQATADLPVGGTITASFVSSSQSVWDESAGSLWVFGVDNPVSVLASTGVVASASTVCGSIDQTVSTGSNLRFRAVASESSHSTALTTSSGWSPINVSRSNASFTANAIRGEFLVTASSTAASSPTFVAAVDHASVYFVLQEEGNQDGVGSASVDWAASGEGSSIVSASGAANVEFVAAAAAEVTLDGAGAANIDFDAAAVSEEGVAAGSANIDFAAAAEGENASNIIEDVVGEAAIDIDAAGVSEAIVDGYGFAEFGVTASAASAFSYTRVKVIQTVPRSGRSVTRLSHTGFN